MNDKIISVSEYLDNLNWKLKEERAKILGEVSGLQLYEGKNYLFFNLKDKEGQATLNCFMWKSDYRISGVELKDGLEIIVSAYPEIWKPTGRLSMRSDAIELVGEGALKLAYEKLKKKLELEGLFDISLKQELPKFPTRIGVITSRDGAVIHDFLGNLGKFGFEIYFVNSRVEGTEATKELLLAVKTLAEKSIDVLVMLRGGGSLESFLAFNNESLVRAVRDFGVPVLTGIGHDKDIPLVSLASDINVSTPTAAANILNSSWNEAVHEVRLSEEKILGSFDRLFETFRRFEENFSNSISSIGFRLSEAQEKVSLYARELIRGFTLVSSNIEKNLNESEKLIRNFNPTRQLSFGYSIVRSGGKILRSVKNTKIHQELDITLSDGNIRSKIL